MALDKLVDSTVLDANLTSVANAIRSKTGDSSVLSFPSGMVNAIGTISGAQEPYTEETFVDWGELYVRTAKLHGYEYIRANMFRDAYGLLTVELNEGINRIGASAFSECTGLVNITLPSTLEIVGASAFWHCQAMVLDPHFPISLKTLNNYAFGGGCKALTEIILPAGLQTIGVDVFNGATNIQKITFLGTPTTLNTGAFGGMGVVDIYVPWAEGAIAGAPWGATHGTIHYEYTPEV